MGGHIRMPLVPIALLVIDPVAESREHRQRRHLAGFDGLKPGSMVEKRLERRRGWLLWPPEAGFRDSPVSLPKKALMGPK